MLDHVVELRTFLADIAGQGVAVDDCPGSMAGSSWYLDITAMSKVGHRPLPAARFEARNASAVTSWPRLFAPSQSQTVLDEAEGRARMPGRRQQQGAAAPDSQNGHSDQGFVLGAEPLGLLGTLEGDQTLADGDQTDADADQTASDVDTVAATPPAMPSSRRRRAGSCGAKVRPYDPIVRVGGDECTYAFTNTMLAAASARAAEVRETLGHRGARLPRHRPESRMLRARCSATFGYFEQRPLEHDAIQADSA